MSEMMKSWTWIQKRLSAFFVNVFWSNIVSWNCYHKYDIFNLIYMIFHMELIFKARPCQECRKYSKKKQESSMHLQNSHFTKLYMPCLWLQFQDKLLHKKTLTKRAPDIFWIQVRDFNNSEFFFTKTKTSRNEKWKQ